MATDGSQNSSADLNAQLRQAMTFHQNGALADAEQFYLQILHQDPSHFDALQLLGVVAFQRGQFADADRLIGQALAIKPDHAAAQYNRGLALLALQRPDEALKCHEQAVTLRPNYVEALTGCGNALHALKRPDEALEGYRRALEINPHYAEALNNRSVLLQDMNRFDEALVSADCAVKVNPDAAASLYNRANAQRELNLLVEAVASYDRALTINPNYAVAWANRGLALLGLQRLDDALQSYDRALAIYPNHLNAYFHLNVAICKLLSGDFQGGFEEFEWRWQNEPLIGARRDFDEPQWLGEDIAGKTLLLHAEQGHGDTINFCRYATLVAERGARVILEVQPALKSLLHDLAGVDQIVVRGEPLPAFDLHCPLMSLPRAFKTDVATIPASIPYVYAPSGTVAAWHKKLGDKKKPRIGFAWCGNPALRNDRNRSIAVRLFEPLLARDVAMVSLQKDMRPGDAQWLAAHSDIYHFSEELRDFTDTAALVSLMDVVVTVDTVVAHLAGAMGKKVFVLLPFVGVDWRWLLDREDSPWYPTARLFRQPAIGDWESVIACVAEELAF